MTKRVRLDGVPNRKVLLRAAEKLGCKVTAGNGGEVRVESPSGERVNLNNRRKDGTRALLLMLKRLANEQG